jgi:hypothetical protein
VCHRFKGFEQAGFEKNGGACFKRILLVASQ